MNPFEKPTQALPGLGETLRLFDRHNLVNGFVALKTRFGEHVKVIMTVEEPLSETPVQKRAREEQEKQQAAEESVR